MRRASKNGSLWATQHCAGPLRVLSLSAAHTHTQGGWTMEQTPTGPELTYQHMIWVLVLVRRGGWRLNSHTKSYYLKFSISIIFLWVFMFLFHSNSHFQWWGALSPYKMIMNILSRQVIIWLIILHYRLLQQKLQEHFFSEFSIKSIRPQTPKLH